MTRADTDGRCISFSDNAHVISVFRNGRSLPAVLEVSSNFEDRSHIRNTLPRMDHLLF